MYLFDTDVITNILKKHPSQKLLMKLTGIPKREQFISTVTVAEIVYGAMKSNRPVYHMKNLEEILLPSVNICSFDLKAAYVYGRLRSGLEKKGTPLTCADLEIAASALANGYILVTGNMNHFQRIEGLRVESWL